MLSLLPAFGQQGVTLNSLPSRVLGHPRLQTPAVTSGPNLIEGREFSAPQSVALDRSSNPPILYVADTNNNRVLAFRTAGISRGNMADRVIGQRDRFSTFALGPGTNLSTGLSAPVGVAVDGQGNLYVIDAGNNRVVRYPRPLEQPSELVPIDLVIGQRAVGAGNQPNQGQSTPSAKTLFFAQGSILFRASLTFDPQGNLWVADPGNNRVLRFPVSQLSPNTPEPEADLVLGQSDFTLRGAPQPPNNVQTNKLATVAPSGIAIDNQGRVYVSDAFARVLFFVPPFANGSPASRVLGVLGPVQQGQPAPTFPNNTSLGSPQGGSPEGLFLVGNQLWVNDTPNHRVVRYGPPESWPAETTAAPSPSFAGVLGQIDFFTGRPNRGNPDPSDNSLNTPVSGAVNGTDIYIADSLNNRVLVFPQSGAAPADRVLGQVDFIYGSPNLVEGREFFIFGGNLSGLAVGGSGIAIDRRSDPPRLYIADSLNNRILGFKDARNIRPGDPADVVIGQTDFFRTTINAPGGDPLRPNDLGLFQPVGLAVDTNGDLWVADRGNARVLRFPRPFDAGTTQRANLVLGQSSFNSRITDASSSTMNQPYGVAVFFNGDIAVSDVQHNRVLIFRKPAGGDFQNGQAAAIVLGQTDFISIGTGTQEGRFNTPTHLAADTGDRLYVSDTRNGRVQIFTNPTTAVNGAPPSLTLGGLSSPHGIAVSPNTGELWVANTFGNQAIRYPEFTNLVLNPGQVTARIDISAPLTLVLDPVDNLIVAEAVNRIAFYYGAMTFQNAANYGTRALAPGMLAYLYRLGRPYEEPTGAAAAYPWPTDLSDVQVFVDGTPAPLFRVNPGRLDIQIPYNAPRSGAAEVQVVRRSSGQILTVGQLAMREVDPGFFTSNQQGTGQIAAINQDGTINSPSAAAPRGSVVALYGTGLGPVAGAPPDGQPNTGVRPSSANIVVIFQGVRLGAEDILYSGLADFPGGWQLNIRVPQQAAPNVANVVAVTLNDVPSNRGPGGATIQTTISVR